MPFRNTAEAYGSVAKFLHWAIVLLIIGQWLLAEAAEDAGKGTPERASLMGWHISSGMLILMLVLVRIGWKIVNKGQPALLGDVVWQRKTAAAGHGILYLLILLQPLTGWLVVSTGGSPIGFFGWFDFPALTAEDHDFHETMESVHKTLFNVLVAVAVVHVAAALYHHWILKDATLRRILPFTRS
ncbi:MAG: cytochrome b [Steroidobacteraceae bacterium]|jgi:cytochrome b561|nr:cytochrome b [Steroidobacteraceae bacterium]